MSAGKGLEAYRKRRDFRKSPEPQGKKKGSDSKRPLFVIHKHDATNLHYDLRLEVDGDKVVLRGDVSSAAQRQTIEMAARHAPGVCKIVNRLRVTRGAARA